MTQQQQQQQQQQDVMASTLSVMRKDKVTTFGVEEPPSSSFDIASSTVIDKDNNLQMQQQQEDEDVIASTLSVMRKDNLPAFGAEQPNPQEQQRHEYELLLLVQGSQSKIYEWCQRVMETGNDYVLLVFASYDVETPNEEFNNIPNEVDLPNRTHCRSMYIPNTTWTQGRNELAKAAYCVEQQLQQIRPFKYWIFADDDVDWKCPPRNNANQTIAKRNYTMPTGRCWYRYFEYVRETVYTNMKVPIVSVVFEHQSGPNRYMFSEYYDAILNAMDRRQLHLLLPYITEDQYDEEGFASWWMSAFMQIYIVTYYFPPGAFMYGYRPVTNPVHRDYPRGLPKEGDIASKIVQEYFHPYDRTIPLPNYGRKVSSQIKTTNKFRLEAIERLVGKVLQQDSNNSTRDTNHLDKEGNIIFGAPMKQRFEDWLTSWGPNCSNYTIMLSIV